MPKKRKYEVKEIQDRDKFEDLIQGQRAPLPEGSLIESVWLLVKYSEKGEGYTAQQLADYFNIKVTQLRSAVSGLNRRGYFVSFVAEHGKKEGKFQAAGVLRDVFASDEAWETAWGRRLRQFLLPHMQRVAKFGELTAYTRPHLLPQVAALINEANQEWSDTRKTVTRALKAAK